MSSSRICPTCRQELGSRDTACPRCGTPLPSQPAQSDKSARRGYRRFLLHGLVTLLIILVPLAVDFFFGVLHLRMPLRTSPLVTEAVDRANDHSGAVDVLGRPIRAGWFVKGYMRQDETGWGEARLWIPVTGPKGQATLHARAGRGSGPWVFSALELRGEDRAALNLLEPDSPSATVPVEPGRRAYLVRLGPQRSISLDSLPDYYRAKLNLTVEILPPLPLESGSFNPERNQFVAEGLIASMQRHLPRLAADPAAVVIGVTEADMYIRAFDWRFAFNYYRGTERFAVVSTARMTPWLYRLRGKEYFLHARMRKMVSRDIGLLVYRLPLSQDPTSLLYGNVGGLNDLDLIQERFEGLGTKAVVNEFAVSHRQAPSAPVIIPRAAPSPGTGRYPCFVVRPGTRTVTPGPATAEISECVPDLHADREMDELEINLRSGAFIVRKTDLFAADVIPLVLTRSYRIWDDLPRAFGTGTNHPYDTFTVGSRQPYTFIDLIFPDGYRVHYDRISQGTGYADAVYEHTATSTRFLRSRIQWNGNGWDLRFQDGTVYLFPEAYAAKKSADAALIGIRDAQGRAGAFRARPAPEPAEAHVARRSIPGLRVRCRRPDQPRDRRPWTADELCLRRRWTLGNLDRLRRGDRTLPLRRVVHGLSARGVRWRTVPCRVRRWAGRHPAHGRRAEVQIRLQVLRPDGRTEPGNRRGPRWGHHAN